MATSDLLLSACSTGIVQTKFRHGTLTFFESEQESVLIVRAEGIVGLWLARRDLQWAYDFARRHRHPWYYVGDLRGVLLPNPLNVFYFRKLRKLTGLGAYVIVVNAGIQGRLAKLFSPLVGATVVRTQNELLTVLTGQVR